MLPLKFYEILNTKMSQEQSSL